MDKVTKIAGDTMVIRGQTYDDWMAELADLRAENERLRDVAWKHGNRADEAEDRLTVSQTHEDGWRTRAEIAEAENERLRKIERFARAAVETERALGFGKVRLTALADVLEEFDRDKCR